MRKIAIIANPNAGRGRAPNRAQRLEMVLRRAGIRVESHVPGSVAEGREIVESAIREGCDGVVIAGGDGSIRDVLDLLSDSGTALGVLPCGRGNDLVRGLQTPRSVRAFAQVIVSRRTRSVDLGVANDRTFATSATCGLDAEVGRLTASGSLLGGSAGYVVQALRSIRTFTGYEVSVESEGHLVYEGEVTLVACSNTATYGGGLKIAPGADVTDGMLELCVIGRVSRIESLTLFPLLSVGAHVGHPAVTVHRTSVVRIYSDGVVPMQVDGEPLEADAMEVGVRKGALRIMG